MQGVDSAWNTVTEVVSLSADLGVSSTSNLFLRVHRVKTLYSGINNTNIGELWVGGGTVTEGVPADKYSHVASGNGQSLQAFYSLQQSAYGYISNIFISVSQGKSVVAELYERDNNGSGDSWNIKERISIYEDSVFRKFDPLIRIDEKSDIEFRVTGGASGTDVSASFDVIIVPKDV